MPVLGDVPGGLHRRLGVLQRDEKFKLQFLHLSLIGAEELVPINVQHINNSSLSFRCQYLNRSTLNRSARADLCVSQRNQLM